MTNEAFTGKKAENVRPRYGKRFNIFRKASAAEDVLRTLGVLGQARRAGGGYIFTS